MRTQLLRLLMTVVLKFRMDFNMLLFPIIGIRGRREKMTAWRGLHQVTLKRTTMVIAVDTSSRGQIVSIDRRKEEVIMVQVKKSLLARFCFWCLWCVCGG